ncbi:MAG: KEOPS complex subunit Pcc1 [Candidatus Bathyarchaeota archaeon]|jgi:KEOPS complex subunit Pcc1
MKAKAVVRIDFSSKKALKVVLDSLRPETEISSTKRSEIQMRAEKQCLILEFRAKDTSALRASMNSYLRLIGVAMNLQNLTK